VEATEANLQLHDVPLREASLHAAQPCSLQVVWLRQAKSWGRAAPRQGTDASTQRNSTSIYKLLSPLNFELYLIIHLI
jgi:hypothetical protein